MLQRQAEAMAVLQSTRAARGLPPVVPVARGGVPAAAGVPCPSVPTAGPGAPVVALYRRASGRIRLTIGTVETGQIVVELLPDAARALAVSILDAVDQGRGRNREAMPKSEEEPDPESEGEEPS
jgi:hypothetical protein